MNDEAKRKSQLIAELNILRQQVAELEALLLDKEPGLYEQLEQEVVQRQRAEEELRKERGLLRTLINNLPHLIYVKNTEFRFVLASRMTLYTYGLSDEAEIIGKTDFDIHPPELAQQYHADEQKIFRTGKPLINKEEPYLNYLTNERGWLLTTKVPLRDSYTRITGLICMSRDITERKQTELERARFRAILDQSSEAILVLDVQTTRYIDVNQTACRLLGYTREELLALGPADIIVNFPFQTPQEWQAHLEEIRQTTPLTIREVYYRRKENTTFPAEVMLTYQNFEGKDYLLAMVRDVSLQKRLEDRLRQAQKMEAVGQLAGGVAHNFNNMLTAIMGYVGLALDSLASDHPIANDLQSVQQTTHRAANLTQQLLAFTRSQVTQPQVINLNELIPGMNAMLRQLISEAIELTTLLAPDLGPIKIDPGQIEQVLINLVINARDAMPHGGKLIIESANITLDQTYTNQHPEVNPGEYVMLAVTDTGQGITEEIIPRIFEPFFTTKEVGQGTGLGLATCFGIVKQNKGHISVYSEPEQGTTFRVYLPRVGETTPKPPLSVQLSQLPGGTETILIVEDEIIVRQMAAKVLRQQGYLVLEAADGEDALKTVQTHSEQTLHLLITDVIMPRMSGNILAANLKAFYPAMRVLYISGYTGNTIIQLGILTPGVNYLGKPFTPDILTQKVREILDKSRSA